MVAVVEGLLQHSRVKSNRNRSNLLHVKMFSAARLDYMVLSKQEVSLWHFNRSFSPEPEIRQIYRGMSQMNRVDREWLVMFTVTDSIHM